MTKYTPGPWTFSKENHIQVVCDRNCLPVAAITMNDDADEELANARLIAAAPEGLELAEQMRIFLDSYCLERGSAWRDISARVNSFLAKAKGE